MIRFISIFIFILFTFISPNILIGKCVNLFYDSVNKSWSGRLHLIFLENLISHFDQIQQIITPIHLYKSGTIEKCESNIYLSTHYDSNIPQVFLKDFKKTKKKVAWLGYNLWKYSQSDLNDLWSVKFIGLSKLDYEHRDLSDHPGFFKFYEYKGETFYKYGDWNNKDPKLFVSAFEITMLEPNSGMDTTTVVSWARHNVSKQRTPYIIRKENKWYVGDSPFSFMHEDDRYLIFADVLFDILEEEPLYQGKKPAVLRLEDINSKISTWQMWDLLKKIEQWKIPANIAIFPYYVDPLGFYDLDHIGKIFDLKSSPEFLEVLEKAKKMKVSFIYHGVTHQYGRKPNPHTGASGEDFEFWDRVENKPVFADSPEWVLNRLNDGYEGLKEVGIKPIAWEVPHYQASPLDYSIFGQVFNWNIGRVIYFISDFDRTLELDYGLNFDHLENFGNKERLAFFKNHTVTYNENSGPNGQFFPYESYGDYYGQRVIPENLGNFEPYINYQVHRTRTSDEIIASVKRNRILRDVWASFFFHVQLLDVTSNEGMGKHPGDMSQLESVIRVIQENNYEFISLEEWTKSNYKKKRPITIEFKE